MVRLAYPSASIDSTYQVTTTQKDNTMEINLCHFLAVLYTFVMVAVLAVGGVEAFWSE